MNRRELVLAALRQAGATGVSGETLAEELGVSRMAVAKHVAALREAGYVIDARRHEGYTLVSAPDLPLPLEVEPLLTHPLWVRVEGAEETGSTNDDARALAEQGAEEGTVVVAAKQNAGRGRLGRTWESPFGGAYASVVLRPGLAAGEISALPLVVALGVADGIARLGVDAQLKWPNDVLLDGRKLAGILLEMAAEADCIRWIVVGIGLNVSEPQPTTLSDCGPADAAYLADDVPSVRSAVAAAAVLDGVAARYERWLTEGFDPMRADYEVRHVLTGSEVVVRDALGRQRAAGRVVGVDADGRLVLETPEGRAEVSAGEVTLRASR